MRSIQGRSLAVALEAVTLSSARGRAHAFLSITGAVYLSPYSWLAHLSIWGAMGWKDAPSIGLTRAYWLLLHGQPVAAYARNGLIYPVLLIWIAIFLNDAVPGKGHRQSIHPK